MKITVEQFYIDAGVKGDCARCPIALAILGQAALPVSVWPDFGLGVDQPYFNSRLNGTRYPLPPEANEFAVKFDAGEKVSPFSFEIDLT